jgi:hypothetical protein
MSFGVRFDLQSPWHNCVKMLHVADGGSEVTSVVL